MPLTNEEARKLVDLIPVKKGASMTTPEQSEQIARLRLHFAMEMAAEINRLKSQVEALQADAERYRWLRDSENSGAYLGEELRYIDAGSKQFDAVIDAARKDQP